MVCIKIKIKINTKSKSFKYNNKSIVEIQFHDKNIDGK